MIKRNKVDLASLYPTPKSYDEIEAERAERKERNKPRHVPVKVAVYWTMFVTILIATYYLCNFIVRDSLVSPLGVIIGICIMLFVMMLGLMILKHVYSKLKDLLYSLRTSYMLHVSFFVIAFAVIMAILWLSGGSLVVLLIGLIMCFIATWLFVGWAEGSGK